ncbi:MAG TPA: hypothetical protein QF468_14560 [Nitrospinota bacterium]|jgi:hypothetical protein|nr:hypothetical protein [Nitrospinota bacterium]|tara:strand:- start:473 stop:790 length:318 start_codon:yes stop_codon:yes gene_type:complete
MIAYSMLMEEGCLKLNNKEQEPSALPNKALTISDLATKEIWELVKYGYTTIFVCTIVFVIPYLIFADAVFGLDFTTYNDSGSKWFSIIMILVIIYYDSSIIFVRM